MTTSLRVTVWNEFRQEKTDSKVAAIYPHGLHEAIAAPLRAQQDLAVRTATLDEPEHGLGDGVLEGTDVLVWWGHSAHQEVTDKVVARIQTRVLEGMGLIVLHSGHFSKIFKSLMGTSCTLKWRLAHDRQRIWTIMPAHPIAAGLPEHFELPTEEMYGEPFSIPTPDELIFVSWFSGGEVFRSGATWQRGNGRVFYFQPGHETCPTYHDPNIQRVITNAVRWARPVFWAEQKCVRAPALETPSLNA